MAAAKPIFVLALVMQLAACGLREAQAPQQHAAAVIAAPAGNAARALQAAAAAYEQAGGERVQVDAIGADGYLDQVSAALLAGLDRYDLVYLPAGSLPRWVQYHALRPLPEPADEMELMPWLEGMRFESGGESALYGLPVQPDPLVLWYRVDVLAANGSSVPFADWQAYAAAAEKINNPPSRYGAAVAGGEYDAGAEFVAALAGSDPGALDALAGRGEVGAPALQSLARLVDLAGAGGASPPDTGSFLRDDVVSSLASGRAAMGFAPVSAGERLFDCAASPEACQDGKPLLAAAALPGLNDCAGPGSVSAWVVPLHAAHAEAAERFAAWLVSEEGARAWAAGGGIPAHRTALRSIALPGFDHLADAACVRSAFGDLTTGDQAWKALHAAAHAAIISDIAPQQALANAGEEIRKALRRSGELE